MAKLRINRFTAGYGYPDPEPDQAQAEILAAYVSLDASALVPYPSLAWAAVSGFVAEALATDGPQGTELGDRRRRDLVVGLLGSCQTALVVCAANPQMAAEAGLRRPGDPEVRHMREAVAQGANEIGTAGPEGLIQLVNRTAPVVVDGLDRHVRHPQRLIHHVISGYLMVLSRGFFGDEADPRVERGIGLALRAVHPSS